MILGSFWFLKIWIRKLHDIYIIYEYRISRKLRSSKIIIRLNKKYQSWSFLTNSRRKPESKLRNLSWNFRASDDFEHVIILDIFEFKNFCTAFRDFLKKKFKIVIVRHPKISKITRGNLIFELLMEALTRLGFTRILDFELILASDPDKSRKITPKITWPIRHQSQNRLRLFHLFSFMTNHHKLFFMSCF